MKKTIFPKYYFNSLLSLFVLLGSILSTSAQTILTPSSITASVDPFNQSVTMVSNLNLNITTSVNSSTTFPYSPSSNFSNGIGFVSDLGEGTGTITYTFSSLVAISRMMIWNGYFNFELDHCAKNVQLVFKDISGSVINSVNLSLPQATSSVLTPHVEDFPAVSAVKSVDIVINTLWGGNEISLRRIAFAGGQHTSGIASIEDQNTISVFPNPSLDRVTVSVSDIQSASMVDINGKSVDIELSSIGDHTEIRWDRIASGLYYLQINTPDQHYFSRVSVK